MKQLLLALTIFLHAVSGHAQQFAPIGSEWYNEGIHSLFHIRAVKDTVIDQIPARQIAYTPHTVEPWASLGFKLNTPPTKYVYNNNDTVFIYNVLLKKFTPLYVFNVADGDTVTLPLTVPNNGCAWFMGSLGDSLFSFVIDSVRAVLYDTAYLQTFYTHPLSLPGRQTMSFPVYARVLGSLSTGLLPDCDSCMMLTSATCSGPLSVRCYNSATHSIKLVSDDCAKGIKVSVGDIYKEGIAVNLFPNHVTEGITLQFSRPFIKQVHYSMTDMAGREVLAGNISPFTSLVTYDVSQLAAGHYNFILRDGNSVVFKKKLAVIR